MTKFKVFTGDKMILNQKLKFELGKVKIIVGKGENVGYKHFLLFSQCFLKLSFLKVLKVGTVF